MFATVSNINLFTRDINISKRFYADTLGLPLSSRSVPPSFYLFDAGGVTITLQDGQVPEAGFVTGSSIEIGFAVEDVDVAYGRLQSAGIAVTVPVQMGWGSGFDAIDPDGNRLSFFQKRG